jgi:hypothetical protein
MNTTYYYFAEKCLLEAFESCKAAIFAELSSAKAIELEKNVIVMDHEKDSEYTDDAICIDSVSVLKEQVAFLIKEFEIDLVAIYLTESDIQQRINVIKEELKESEEDHIIKDFSLEFVNDSHASVLFNVMFARQVSLLDINDNEPGTEYKIEYEDYEYTEIFDKINDCLDNIIEFEYEYDHTGGDVGNNAEYLELYYKFTKKIEEKKTFSGDILSENCSNESEAEGLAIANKMKEIYELRYPGSEINIVTNTQGSNPNPVESSENDEYDIHIGESIYEEACEQITDDDIHNAQTELDQK